MGPVEAGVKVVSHHLAPVVDAGGEGVKISRQRLVGCECAVRLPKSGYVVCAISAADFPSDLAPVVNDEGDIGTCTSEVLKHEGSVVFPHYGVRRCDAASRVAYRLALIVDAECDPICIAAYM